MADRLPRLRLVFSAKRHGPSPPTPPSPRRSTRAPSTRQLCFGPGAVSNEVLKQVVNDPAQSLINAGYRPPVQRAPTPTPSAATPPPDPGTVRKQPNKPKMAEPRARAARHKGQMNFSSERELAPKPVIYYLISRLIDVFGISPTPSSRIRRSKPTPIILRRATP